MRTNSLSTINAPTHPERIRRSHKLKHPVNTTRLLSAIFALFVFLFFLSAVSVAGLGNGSDGELVVSSLNTIVNTYTYMTSTSTLAGSSSFVVNNADGFSVGDEILIIQTQHSSNAGVYEAGTINQINGNTISLENNLTNTFYSGTFNTTNASSTQIIRVPQYTDVDINSGASITASAWDGYSGGIVVFRATGTVTVNGSINTTGKGFRGGYCVAGATGNISYSGECYLGLGSNDHAVNVGGGSGAQRLITSTGGGGGGGGYGTAGTNGEYWGNSAMLGLGGGTYGVPQLSNIYLGAGGGGGIYTAGEGDGGPGGGVILIFANSIVNNNSISSNGGAGENSPNGGSGGGGSGGSVLLSAENIIAGTNTITSTGGAKGTSNDADGGGGGDGRIRLDYKFINNKPYQDTSEENSSCDPDPGYSQEVENIWHGLFQLALDHTKIDEDLTDFPILLHLSNESGTNQFDASAIFDELMTVDPNDDFTGNDGDAPDTEKWSFSGSPTIQSNKMYHNVSSDHAYDEVISNFALEGDFDIQIDFDIVTGSATNRWFTYIRALLPNGNNVYVERTYTNDSNQYRLASSDGSWHLEASNVTADTSGKLRLTRIGTIFRGYFWNGSDWTELGNGSSYVSSNNTVRIVFTTGCATNYPSTGVAIDNFFISSGNIIWPDGDPNRKKIAVYDQNGNQCYTEIEHWDSANKEAWLWVKVPQVSSTEDTVLKIYYDKNNPDNLAYIGEASDALDFQTAVDKGSEGIFDAAHTSAPCVIKDGDIYKMWYGGHNGTNWRILYATSLDGITWSDHQMVLGIGSEGTYDILYTSRPSVIQDGDVYRMWYSGYDGTSWRILHATSSDGITWSDHQMVVDIGSEGTYDTVHARTPCVIKDGDTYKMWYSGSDGSNRRILYATSPDGITWSDHQMAVDKGTEGTDDTVHAYAPSVIKDGDVYWMWYAGHDGTTWRILHATSSDGIVWSDHQTILDKGSEGTYDALHVIAPSVIKDGDIYKMWYAGNNGTNSSILFSQSYTPTWETPSQNVWDNNFAGVWHMSQDPTGDVPHTVKDSTKNNNHGTPAGGMASSDLIDGKIGKSINFDGSDDYIVVGTSSRPMNTFTYGGWIKATTTHEIDSESNSGTNGVSGQKYIIVAAGDDDSGISVGNNGISVYEHSANYMPPLAVFTSDIGTDFNHIMIVYNNRQPTIYLNGVAVHTGLISGLNNVYAPKKIGGMYYGYFPGVADEVRISSTARSPAWIKATYYSNFDDLIFYSSDIDTTAPPEVDTLTVNDTGSGTSVVLDWSGYDELAAGDIASYRIYVETAEFADVPETPFATVSVGQFTYTAGGLDRNQIYYFAVVAVDYAGNAILSVSTPPAIETPTDTEPPEEVTNLQVACAENSLTFTWDHSADTAGDLTGYKVYFNGDTEGVSLDASQNSYVATELSPATNYDFKVTVFDGSTNESVGVATPGVTLLDNPTNLTPTPWYSQVNIVWDSVVPADLIQTYAVYVSQSPFTSVEGMTPTLITSGTSAGVESLTGNTTYYFAVTTINISNGEQKNVTTVSAVPLSATYVSGNINQDTTWTLSGSPYIVTGDITVRHSNYRGPTATLTIEPGVEVRFEPGTGLYIGYPDTYWWYGGALSAQGTVESPIIFTSNAASPTPGDWKGIVFRYHTNYDITILEHSVVEYGGHTNNANIHLENAKPTIQYNTIKNSSQYGIYVSSAGSNNAAINCNNLKDNLYGVYVTSNAQPQIHNNNLLRNQNYGIYNASGVTVNAENNWWGDINGPGYNGDTVYGNVDVDPWLTVESDCISAPPTNTPPFTPKNPSPADGAVRVPVIQDSVPLDVTLNWVGGDPNPWDTVVYDVYFGESAGSLVVLGDGISATSFTKSDLAEGTTYYWQIVSRDDAGGQTPGPVWQFTTLGAPPDLAVANITWDPADNLAAGQAITFTATIQNIGTGPAVDAFHVDFKIDGSSIGSESVSPVIAAGGTVQVTKTWTAGIGDHTIEVVADSTGAVTEAFEDNNSGSENLPTVIDPAPPELADTSPVNGAALPQVDQIVITLLDQHGTVDDAAVIAGIEIRNGSSQLVDGTVSESSDVFTFTPAIQPLADDIYSVTLTAVDMYGNTQNYNFTFTVDGQPPAKPLITGGTIFSGVIQARPYADNRSNTSTVTLTGTRENNTNVWVNNVQRVASGTGDWSAELTLSEGDNALEIWLKDAANNQGDSEWVDIFVDSTAPAVTSITPADNSFLGTAPATVVVDFQETGSGLNLDNCLKSVKDNSQNPADGSWTVSGGNQLIFTPSGGLAESLYTIDIQLEDELGNRGNAVQYHFTVDTTAPAPPVINPVTSPAYNPSQIISGTKEAYAAVLLNGEQVVGYTAETTWQHTVNMVSGQNQFTFAAKDRAGNQSDDAIVSIVYDDIPPLPVNTLTADGQTSGTIVNLNWSGYDESVHGDIDFYRIYVETSSFSNVAGLTVHATVDVGNFTYTVENLTKGAIYWFAVVAVDFMGHADSVVTSVSAAPTDTVAPEDVTNLNVTSYEDRLVFSWMHSVDTQGDLAGYKVYFNSATEGISLPSTQNSYEKTGLNPAAAYPFKVTAFDNDDNESAGVSVNGVTLLPNPTNLAATPYSGYVDLSWDAVQPSQYVQHYRIYVSTTDFTSIESMTPQLTTTATAANIAGLTNNTTYYFAVTTLNISNGEHKAVATVPATPVPDTQGPETGNFKVGDTVLVNGLTLDKPSTVTLNAADPAGVSRVEFYLNGNLIRTDFSGPYSCYLDVDSLDDGAYTLTITAYDTLGNSTTVEFTLNVALAPPAAPVITQPADGLVTNQLTVTIAGQTEKDAEVLLYNNSAETGDVTAADGSGNFSSLLTLTEGENHIQAAARNRAGTGPLSSEVLVTLDTSIPYSPTALSAQAKEGGTVMLTWQPPTETSAAGYNLYRAQNSFTTPAQAVKVNTILITATSFTDLPPQDGTWYYRITTVDSASNESDLSAEASAEADRTPPRAISIDYTPQGNYDPVTETMAPGTVDLVLTVNEPLLSTPFLSINPEGGTPLSVELTKDTDVTYAGFFVIADTTPTGTAWAIFSARDAVGNRGTAIDAGASIKIDTDGPIVSRLEISPLSPVKNDEQSPVSVTVSIGLNEAVKYGVAPQLSYLLSKDGRETTVIDAVTQIDTVPGDVQTWQAVFELPADAGLSEPETFSFIFQAADDLDNVSSSIAADNLFQVYQGDLPPLETPQGLTGEALSGGLIRLTWEPVEGAVGYQLYRQAPIESELTAYQRIDSGLEYTDEPDVDGLYIYAVASIRSENDQESFSSMSASVQVTSDSTAPGVPQNLGLELVANGIKIEWDAPAYTEPITYHIYRSDLAEITSVEGLTPLIVGIPQTLVIDPNPSSTEHCYAVTAVDEAGNQSAPSTSIYQNFGLLPVSSLLVVQTGESPPVISWTHPSSGSIAGYDFYLGDKETGIKLHSGHLTALSYTDNGYAEDERTYTLIAVDQNEAESLERTITLPVMRASLSEGSRIKRGIMNRLEYTVQNLSPVQVEHIRLKVDIAGHAHMSESFSLQPLTSNLISVIVGGYDDLADVADVTTTIEITPHAGETIRIVRTSQVDVGDGMLVLQILNEEFTRGATGSVRFTLENSGEADIEITCAQNSGNADSNEIIWYLLDEDENVIATKAFRQSTGAQVVTLANGNSVARIAAGDTFTSEATTIPVPAGAPDNVIVKLAIENIYYHQGQTTQVKMDGLAGTRPIILIDTSYYGAVTDITPPSSTGDQDIVITGRAVERSSNDPLPGVPLNLVITLNGFERKFEVLTSDDGIFTYTFTPLAGEAGIYTVRAVHPDLTDRPAHGQFVINRVSVTPTTINLGIPFNYEKTISLNVAVGDGTAVNNLELVYDQADQPGGVFPQGLHVTLGSPVAFLGSGQSASLAFTLWADNTADQTGVLVFKVKSDEIGQDAWGTVQVNTAFSEALPVLNFTPTQGYINTGLARDDTVTETIVLKNTGLAAMNDIFLTLVDQNGDPAQDWVYLNTSADQGSLAVGESRKVSVSFSPTQDVDEGDYDFFLRMTSSNYQTTNFGLYVTVTQSGEGNVMFKVGDIYTGTLDENDQLIQGLAGAKVKLQNEAVLTEEYTLTTESLGEAYFEGIPAGSYKVRITADNHQEYIGRIWIKPGVSATEEVFLGYNLVTVEWEVNEITIEDKYEIVLTAVYETDVPAAVVVAEPSSVSLPPMAAGDVYNGEFTLTNFGLVRADNLSFTLPVDNAYFTYELSGGLPNSLDAKQVITVPFRVTCVQSPDQSEGDGGGGGCERYADPTTIKYQYTCPAGQVFEDTAFVMLIYDNGQCTVSGTTTAGTGGTVGDVVWNLGGGTDGGGSVSAPAAAPSKIEGVKCFPNCDRKENFCEECQAARKETNQNNTTKTHSAVNTVMREYNRDATDLAVKVQGGRVQVKRWFYDNKWWFEHERNSLSFTLNALGTGIESIDKGGVTYRSLSTDADVFTHDVYRITKEDTGYRWEANSGTWKEYDENGRVTAYGNRTGTTGKLLYEAGENGKLIGYADRNDNQVIWFEYNADNRISAAYDSDNRRVEYSYADGLLTGVQDVLGHDTVFEYDGDGRITRTVDAAGREFIVTYDTYGNPASVVDSQGKGHFFEFDYNSAKKEFYARIRTSANMIKEVWYDKNGDTKRVDVNGRTIQSIAKDGRNLIITDESGHVTRKEFDEWDNLVKVIYPDETTVSYEYEHTFNRRIKETDELGIITQYEYDDAGNLTRKVEAVGSDHERVTEYTYDDDGNLLTTTRLADGDTAEAITTMTYDAYGNMTSITDAENNTTQFTAHDIMGNVLSKIDARDKTWTYAYDDASRLTTVTDPLNNITQMFYDEVGNKVKEIDAEGKEKTFEYDDNDNLIKTTAIIDPDHPENNLVTTFDYNTDNKLTKQTDAEGKVIRYEYDTEGRLVKTLDGNNNEIAVEYADDSGTGCSSCSGGGSTNQPSRVVYPTFEKTFAYDERGRKVSETDVPTDTESYITGFAYDESGNLVSKTDKELKATGYAYDTLNRLEKVTDHLNQETIYTYDNRDNLIELKDAKTNVTRFEYDKNNRLTKETRPMGAETTYTYDAAGNLIEKIDAKNQKTEYVYDDAGRLTDIKHFNPDDHVNPVKTTTFTYDKIGNLKSSDDGTTSAQYDYDAAYRKLSETVNFGPFTKANTYAYYKNGTKQNFTGPDGITHRYLYDSNNQLTGVQIPNAGFISISNYTWNRPANMMLPGGTTKQFEYDPLMRVKEITTKDPGQNVLLSYQYSYDKMDNISAKQTEHGNYDYGYDDLYRLNTTDNPDFDDEAFTYDAVGNRLAAADTTGDWTYNLNNELGGYDDVSYEYDANGNMTQKTVAGVVTKFFYNLEDRLERVEDGVGTMIAAYYYDPFGRRLWKEVAGVKTYFHYSDEGLVAELDASGNVTKSYGYKPGSTWTTDPLFMKIGSDYYFYQNDHLGTPQKLTAINGAVVWAAKYSSYLKADVDSASTIENNLRAPGQYFDQETGLLYNYFRYYDPTAGRYLRPDPVGLLAGVNLFSYALNNPTRHLDPFGLYCKIEHGEPVPGGDPIAWRYEKEKDGYWDAVAQRLAWELLVAKLTKVAKKISIPLPPPITTTFTYILRHTTYATYYLYVQYWEVCYDDCTGKEISREALKPGKIDRTTEVIHEQKDERKYL